jgi:hypothetical protein
MKHDRCYLKAGYKNLRYLKERFYTRSTLCASPSTLLCSLHVYCGSTAESECIGAEVSKNPGPN